MPTIANIYGAKIVIYYEDHMPPHFHIFYQGRKSKMTFEGRLIQGLLTSNILIKIRKYALDNKDFLYEKWNEINGECDQ